MRPATFQSSVALVASSLSAIGFAALLVACGGSDDDSQERQAALVLQGKQVFRYDTFGDEAQWTDL